MSAVLATTFGGILLAGAMIFQVTDGFFGTDTALDFITADVTEAPFEHHVLERGEVGSSSNVELRCRVRSRNSSGVSILEIVPEGAWVEADQFLVRLDDSALQTELIQQQIVCSNSESSVIEAQAAFDGAKLSLEEYKEGTFLEAEEQQESSVFVSRENLRRSEEYLIYSKRLAERGYIPEAQLDADMFAVAKAQKELGVAQTKLKVLQTYTRKKMETQLDADIKTAKARLNSRQKTYELDEARLKEIREQIELCVINAPVAGQVVYANDQDRRGSSGDLLIAEGRPVRERQVIIRLPDPNQMRVVAKVHESRISHIRPGLIADIQLEAMAKGKLRGRIKSVSEYPLPSISVYMSHIKEYAVEIDIIDPPKGLRPGMTAEVSVLVAKLPNATQIPLQSIVGRNGQFFCAVPNEDGSLATRQIKIGIANEENVVVLGGLELGEQVVLNVKDQAILDSLDLPEDLSTRDTQHEESNEKTSRSPKTQKKKLEKKKQPKK
jgi:HlyD family secretion protein